MTEAELRRLKEVELGILLEVKRVCEKLDIQFFLDSGTLLGAARHQGFIPWDDDIDIGMLRDDYCRFLSYAPQLLEEHYWLQNPYGNPDATVSFAKVRRTDTLFLENANKDAEGNQGIWIDIFPFDVVDGTAMMSKRQKKQWRVRHKLFTLRSVKYGSQKMSAPKQLLRLICHYALSPIPKEYLLHSLDSIAIAPCAGGVGMLTSFHYFNTFLEFPLNDAFPLTTLNFEGHEMPVFKNWEKYLLQAYGDWKSLPPAEQRHGHEIIELSFSDA